MMNWITRVWCKNVHRQAMWPIHGKYVCPRCLCEFPVTWEGPATAAEYADPSIRSAGLHCGTGDLVPGRS
jgi:hypothetical protein